MIDRIAVGEVSVGRLHDVRPGRVTAEVLDVGVVKVVVALRYRGEVVPEDVGMDGLVHAGPQYDRIRACRDVRTKVGKGRN